MANQNLQTWDHFASWSRPILDFLFAPNKIDWKIYILATSSSRGRANHTTVNYCWENIFLDQKSLQTTWTNWPRLMFSIFSCPSSYTYPMSSSSSLTATLEFRQKEWLYRLETLQTFDQSDVWTKRQKDQWTKRCQGSFALLRCFYSCLHFSVYSD